MTLTSDGVVRIWIEVVLSPTFGPDVTALSSKSPHGSPRGSPRKRSAPPSPQLPGPASQQAAAGPSNANLCVGLVVQPPALPKSPLGMSHDVGGQWRACWGLPQMPGGFPQSGTGARAHSVLWLIVMQAAADTEQAGTRQQQGSAGSSNSSTALGKVQARPHQPTASQSSDHAASHLQQPAFVTQQQTSPAQAASTAGQPQATQGDGSISLWAIDGLAGVVLGGAFAMVSAGGPPTAPASRRLPRAMLWGQHRGDLAWPGAALGCAPA